MKIRRFFVLFLIFALAPGIGAFADVAYTPRDDFYEKHYRECEIMARYFFINGTEGYAVGFSSPTGEAKVLIPNGKEYNVSVVWSGGDKEWGCIEYDPETLEPSAVYQGGESAWVDMSSMTPRYDSMAFMEEHASEISGEERTFVITPGDNVITYRYPGSGITSLTLQNWTENEDEPLTLNSIYTDAEGREWGYIGYYYGRVNAWVCIDDPYTELPAGAEYREPELIPAADEAAMEKALSEASGLSANIIVGAVGVVVIAAAVVAYIVIRKRRASAA